MNNKSQYFYFSLLLLLVKSKNILKISLETYKKVSSDFFIYENNENENNSNKKKYFIDEIIDLSLYTTMYIGEPEHKIKTLISTTNPYLSLIYTYDRLEHNYSKYEYDINKSKTFKNITSNGIYYIKSRNDILMKEKLKIEVLNYENNKTNLNIIDDINMILGIENINKNNKKIYNLNIGLKLLYEKQNALDNYKYCFIYQLKQKNIINNYYFSLFFQKGKNENGQILYNIDELISTKAELIIGDYPHNYYPSLFDEGQLITILSDYLSWNLYFSNIYFYKKDKNNDFNEKKIIGVPIAEITFNDFLINAPMPYFESIKKYFFEKYLSENICKTDYSGELLILFCEKSENFSITELQKFPSLYFQHDEFRYTFELTYEDLFIEKDNKFWFLVVFETYFDTEKWFLGNLFLRKYYFVFNQDSKTIGFYNLNFPKKIIKEKDIIVINKEYNWKYMITFLFIGCILFIYFGIIITKNIYKNSNKMKAEELNDESECEKNKDVNKQKINKQSVEMNYKLVKD